VQLSEVFLGACCAVAAVTDTSTDAGHPIKLTEAALQHLKKLRSEVGGADLLLRVGVKQGGCSGMSYAMDFEKAENIKEGDDFIMDYSSGEFRIVCDSKSLLYLFGMSMDYSDALIGEPSLQQYRSTRPAEVAACSAGMFPPPQELESDTVVQLSVTCLSQRIICLFLQLPMASVGCNRLPQHADKPCTSSCRLVRVPPALNPRCCPLLLYRWRVQVHQPQCSGLVRVWQIFRRLSSGVLSCWTSPLWASKGDVGLCCGACEGRCPLFAAIGSRCMRQRCTMRVVA
jgi:iron-sulfur cluster assembly protein